MLNEKQQKSSYRTLASGRSWPWVYSHGHRHFTATQTPRIKYKSWLSTDLWEVVAFGVLCHSICERLKEGVKTKYLELLMNLKETRN
ncbi:hypothetical protein BDV26DRAFT_261779 [Aspergillus bertholletiae]|uniref:Uncharacterized protein n=1 Tax=Aspergillus bertholletiae TaxID=1226010 RepID=A0A5N7B9E2_9EURO|nr:hypothetical protein BDV26DRAFT_261779 [Aspergillus bertholletiae]